jgi:hypothetical protein
MIFGWRTGEEDECLGKGDFTSHRWDLADSFRLVCLELVWGQIELKLLELECGQGIF